MKMLHILLLAAAFSILNFNATYAEEIINGRKAQNNSMLYMVSVQNNNKHKCGGFLINPRYVLTAAHCYKRNENLSVIIGTQNIDPQKNLKKHAVERIYQHPAYNGVISGSDIMLLKLSEKVSKGVKFLKFSSKNKPVKLNNKCQVAGWGKTENQNTVNDLLVTDVSIINVSLCKKEWHKVNINLPANVLCAGGYRTTSGACQGDSGGPLVCSGLAVGIVSFNFNNDCNYPNVPNVYSEISAYSHWINQVIKENA